MGSCRRRVWVPFLSYCSCATCSACCCPRGSCWCWCSSFAYSSPYSLWQFNSLSTNGRKLLADSASRFLLPCWLACLVQYRPPTYASLSAPFPFFFSSVRSVNWVVVQSVRSRLSSLPSQRVLTRVHYFYAIHGLPMRIVLIRILLSWTTHSSPVQSIQPASPLRSHSSRWSWLWKNPAKLAKKNHRGI